MVTILRNPSNGKAKRISGKLAAAGCDGECCGDDCECGDCADVSFANNQSGLVQLIDGCVVHGDEKYFCGCMTARVTHPTFQTPWTCTITTDNANFIVETGFYQDWIYCIAGAAYRFKYVWGHDPQQPTTCIGFSAFQVQTKALVCTSLCSASDPSPGTGWTTILFAVVSSGDIDPCSGGSQQIGDYLVELTSTCNDCP